MNFKTEQELVEIDSLKAVKEHMEKEIQNLHYSRANLSNQVAQVTKELRDLESRKLMEFTRQDNLKRREDDAFHNRLNAQSKNLEVMQRQVSDREAAVTRREQKLVDLDQRIDLVRIESLDVERMKKEVKQKELELDAKVFEVTSSIATATARQQDATEKLKKAEELHRQATEAAYRNSDTNKRLAEREQVLNRAEEAISKKIDLIHDMDIREGELVKREKELKDREERVAMQVMAPVAQPAPAPEPVKRGPGRPKK